MEIQLLAKLTEIQQTKKTNQTEFILKNNVSFSKLKYLFLSIAFYQFCSRLVPLASRWLITSLFVPLKTVSCKDPLAFASYSCLYSMTRNVVFRPVPSFVFRL